MKTRQLLLFLPLLCLMACGKRTDVRPNSAWLTPTEIEGRYASLGALMDDPKSTGQSLVDFAGNAEDAVRRCNADKESALK